MTFHLFRVHLVRAFLAHAQFTSAGAVLLAPIAWGVRYCAHLISCPSTISARTRYGLIELTKNNLRKTELPLYR
jgi:hypothetical protein